MQGADALPPPAVPDAGVLAALRRELEAKTAALQAAVASGGPRAAAAAVAAAPDKPPELLSRLLGLRNGEAVLTQEQAEERSRKLPPGYKYVSVPAMAPRSARDDLPPAKAARGGGRSTPGGARGRGATALGTSPVAGGGAGGGARGGRAAAPPVSTAEAEAKLKAAEKERRLSIKKKIAELGALVDHIATSVAAAAAERTAAAAGGSASAAPAAAAAPAVVWGEQTLVAKVEAARSRRLQEINARHSLTTVRQLMAHKWAWPFNEPVDAVKMNLQDYHKVVTRPMDLGTVRARLEGGAGGSGFYNHPDEVAADVRLVFANARAYNPPGSDVHVMATTLSEAFEGRWAANVAPRLVEAAAAATAEGERAQARAAAAAAARATEGTERRTRDLEKALCAAEAALADARRALSSLAPPLGPDERRALATGLRECAPRALGGAVAVLAAAAGVDAAAVPDILEVDLDSSDTLMLRRLLAFVRTAPKSAASARKAEAKEGGAKGGGANGRGKAGAARGGGRPAPRGQAQRAAHQADGGEAATSPTAGGDGKRKRGRPPRKTPAAAAAPPPAPAAADDAAAPPAPANDVQLAAAEDGAADSAADPSHSSDAAAAMETDAGAPADVVAAADVAPQEAPSAATADGDTAAAPAAGAAAPAAALLVAPMTAEPSEEAEPRRDASPPVQLQQQPSPPPQAPPEAATADVAQATPMDADAPAAAVAAVADAEAGAAPPGAD